MAIGAAVNPATGVGTIPGVASGTAGQTISPTGGAAGVPAIPTMNSSTNPATNNPFAAPTAAAINPGTVPGVAPVAGSATSPTTTASSPSLIQSNGINSGASQGTDASNSLAGDFEATYGQGTGTAITDLLNNMGTTDSAAIQATIANTDYAAGQQYSNIQAGEAASGQTANSSTAALAGAQFYTGVNSQLQQTIGSEEEAEQTQELNTLLQEGTAHGGDPSTLDNIMEGIGDAGTIGAAIFGA
jgi:hypothetical protein